MRAGRQVNARLATRRSDGTTEARSGVTEPDDSELKQQDCASAKPILPAFVIGAEAQRPTGPPGSPASTVLQSDMHVAKIRRQVLDSAVWHGDHCRRWLTRTA
jgi:hypothetical protein